MLKNLNSVLLSGKELLPIIEGGKGVAVTNGDSSGAFAKAGAVGTFSGVNPDIYDEQGNVIPPVYHGKTRKDRHLELIEMGIKGGIEQAKIAKDISGNQGAIHINVLWEMGAAEEVLEGVLEGASDIIDGITCGAGMPYKVSHYAEKYNVYYYPIVSSMRAFRALWKRSYHKSAKLLGGVVYEDPWLAGGHNGLSNSEDPDKPQSPYPRVAEIRKFMNQVGLQKTPIIMAGGVWHLKDWSDWLNNPEIGEIAFQYGTRPILTQESPVPLAWKKRLMTLKKGDISLNRFSPTGFYSSGVKNRFIDKMEGRKERQVAYSAKASDNLNSPLAIGARGRNVFMSISDVEKAKKWISEGFTEALKTPDSTLIFVTKEDSRQILEDQVNCMGCLSHCRFSNWKDYDDYTTGKKADPRSFCIQKTLQDIAHSVGDIEDQLMFSGHNAYKFAEDPFYKDGFIPTVAQLVDRIMQGE